jgi:hypothetical protein
LGQAQQAVDEHSTFPSLCFTASLAPCSISLTSGPNTLVAPPSSSSSSSGSCSFQKKAVVKSPSNLLFPSIAHPGGYISRGPYLTAPHFDPRSSHHLALSSLPLKP